MENTATKEDTLTKVIEKQTVKLPSDTFLLTAMGVVAVSLAYKYAGKDRDASFIGQWVAPILLLGVYNKMIKQEDRKS